MREKLVKDLLAILPENISVVHKVLPSFWEKIMVRKMELYAKDSTSWINEIKNDRLNKNDILVSLDVISPCTKIHIEEAIDVIKHSTNERT